jgi:hypothetical protein
MIPSTYRASGRRPYVQRCASRLLAGVCMIIGRVYRTPPCALQQSWMPSQRTSTIFPFPSSPHWAPSTMTADIVLLVAFARS